MVWKIKKLVFGWRWKGEVMNFRWIASFPIEGKGKINDTRSFSVPSFDKNVIVVVAQL